MSDRYYDFQNPQSNEETTINGQEQEDTSAKAEESVDGDSAFAQESRTQQQAQGGGNVPPVPPVVYQGSAGPDKKPRKRRSKEKAEGKGGAGRFFKKAGALLVSGVIFGVAAGGVFIGTANLAEKNGWLPEAAVESAPVDIPTTNVSNNYTPAGSLASVVEEARLSVVSIVNSQIYNSQDYQSFFDFFYGQGGQSNGETQEYEAGSGSGIIIGENDEELLIVTNNHVIEGASSLTITFADDSTAQASVKGTDSNADLAVVAVNLADLTDETKGNIKIAVLGNSDEVQVGDQVIAIGNALGYGQSMTGGWISALNREVTTSDGVTRTLLQTDAAINPGNSGGALLNTNGEVIGINSAKYSSTDVEGVGYAIPISAVESIITDLSSRKTLVEVEDPDKQGYLGVTVITIDQETAQLMNIPQGVYILSIAENAPIQGSGIQAKDIITKVDGNTVSTNDELKNLMQYYEGGTQVEITIQRVENGEYVEHTYTVTLGNAGDYNTEN